MCGTNKHIVFLKSKMEKRSDGLNFGINHQELQLIPGWERVFRGSSQTPLQEGLNFSCSAADAAPRKTNGTALGSR